ncbi:hypothetical protein D9M70_467080 [compost metagenome]
MQQLKTKLANASTTFKREAIIAGGTALALVGSPAFAAEGDWDMTEGLATIAKGAAAALLLGLAFVGFVTLIGALRATRAAGR